MEMDEVWFESLKSVAIITLGGNAAILLFMRLPMTDTLLQRMVSFAIGGLIGDVFLHLIPHSFENNHHDHHDSKIPFSILAGILLFFLAEKGLQSLGHEHSHSSKSSSKSSSKIYLNLVTDFLHNFTDGLALSAAFRTSSKVGKSMTFAITVHEIPHEIGDFAVLLSNGISKWNAFFLQFVSALGALSGCLFGLLMSEDKGNGNGNADVLIGFTAGSFLYVAMTQLMHELVDKKQSFAESVVHVICMSCGIYAMVLISQVEEHEHSHSHGHEDL